MVKTRILIVDDVLFMRNLIKEILTEAGYKICGEASSAPEAVRKYKELKPDLVTLDLKMSETDEMDGLKAIREILSFDAGAKILIVTGLTKRHLLQEAIVYGAKEIIIKPFTSERLLKAIKRILFEKS
jgi:two-component system chemotaxis response regulator CheY